MADSQGNDGSFSHFARQQADVLSPAIDRLYRRQMPVLGHTDKLQLTSLEVGNSIFIVRQRLRCLDSVLIDNERGRDAGNSNTLARVRVYLDFRTIAVLQHLRAKSRNIHRARTHFCGTIFA